MSGAFKLWETDNLWKMGLIACFIINSWAVSQFTSKKDFEDLKDRTYKIEALLGQMKVKNEVDDRQDARISNLETQASKMSLDIKGLEDKVGYISPDKDKD